MTLYLLNLADLASTLLGLSRGLEEINPIINTLLHIHPALFVLVKVVVAYPLCRHIARAAKKSRVDKFIYAAIVAVYTATVAQNLKKTFIFAWEGDPMIHALHLLWIVPLSASFGFAVCAVLTMASRADKEDGH